MTDYPQSPLVEVMTLLGRLGCAEAALATLTEQEIVALAGLHDAWLRPNQRMPPDSEWDLFAFIGARGTGKTYPVSRYVCEKAASGEAMNILLIAQSMKKARVIFATGKCGMLNQPPWLRPVRKGDLLLWPSGAIATITTAAPTEKSEERGDEYDLLWASEVNAWARGCRVEVWRNAQISTRSGNAKVVVDTTPKRGNPIIKEIKDEGVQHRAEALAVEPEGDVAAAVNPRVRWVRHVIEENRINLARGYVDSMRRRLSGTRAEREELDGLEADDGGGLIRDEWIEDGRRNMPSTWKRRIVICDPAITNPKPGGHDTGIVDMGTGIDDQIYVTRDQSGLMAPDDWAMKVLTSCIKIKADCLVIETNRGGNLLDFGLTLLAEKLGLVLQVIELKAQARYTPGVINVKMVHARQDKESRMDAAIVEYKAGKVSHVKGADLESLEETLTNWEPETASGRDSPGDLDCVAWGVIELRGLHDKIRKNEADGQRAVVQAARDTRKQDRSPVGGLRPTNVSRRGRSVSLL